MSQSRFPLAELRQQIGALLGHSTYETLSCSSLSLGIPRGAIIELTGYSRVEWLLVFLSEHPELKVCWLESKFNLLPTALHQRGCNLDHFLFIEAGEDLFKPLRKALRSHVFDVLVSPSEIKDDRALKTLQLFAEKANAALFLLGREPQTAWQISVQLDCAAGDGSVRVLKYKKSRTHPDAAAPADAENTIAPANVDGNSESSGNIA